MSDVTRILNAIEQGDGQAAEELLTLVYEELRKLAAARLANEKLIRIGVIGWDGAERRGRSIAGRMLPGMSIELRTLGTT